MVFRFIDEPEERIEEPQPTNSFRFVDDLGPLEVQPPEQAPEDAGMLSRAGDLAIDLGKGAVNLGRSVVGLSDMATGGLVGRGMREIGYDPEGTNERLSSLYSPERQTEEAEFSAAQGVGGKLETLFSEPATLVGRVAESVPQMLGSAGVARAVFNRVFASTLAKTGSEMAARTAATRAAILAASATEGAQQAGGSFEAMTADGIAPSDAYVPAIGSGLTTAAIGYGAGRLGSKIGLGDVEAGVSASGGLPVRVAKSAVQEGLLEEFPQSATEQAWSNYGYDRPLMQGVPEAGAVGGAVGAVAGGGFGMFSGGVSRDTEVIRQNQPHDLLQGDIDAQARSAMPGSQEAAPVDLQDGVLRPRVEDQEAAIDAPLPVVPDDYPLGYPTQEGMIRDIHRQRVNQDYDVAAQRRASEIAAQEEALRRDAFERMRQDRINERAAVADHAVRSSVEQESIPTAMQLAMQRAKSIPSAKQELADAKQREDTPKQQILVPEKQAAPQVSTQTPPTNKEFKITNPFARKVYELRDRLSKASRKQDSYDKSMENSFPLGVGYGRGSKRDSQRIDRTVREAVESVNLRNNLEYAEAQARAYEEGKINAQGRSINPEGVKRSEKREAQKQLRDERIAAAKAERGDKKIWQTPKNIYADSTGYIGGNARKIIENDHRIAVEKAIASGMNIPEEVLADYPELKKSDDASSKSEFTVSDDPIADGIARFGQISKDKYRSYLRTRMGKTKFAERAQELEQAWTASKLPENAPQLPENRVAQVDEMPTANEKLISQELAVEPKQADTPKQPTAIAETTQKEPWEMTRAEWEKERELIRPSLHALEKSKQGPRGKAQTNKEVARTNRLNHLLGGVTDEASSALKEATLGKRKLTSDEVEKFTDRIDRPVTHRDVVEKAVREGKAVPDAVLSEYKDIKKPKFSKGQRSTGLSRDEATAQLSNLVGSRSAQALIESGRVVLVEDEALMPKVKSTSDYTVQGVTTADKVIHLNLSVLNKDSFSGVALHEGLHATLKSTIGEQDYNRLMQRMDNLRKMSKGGTGEVSKFFKQAIAAIPSDTPAKNVNEEVAAYAVEKYTNAPRSLPQSIAKWVKDFIAAIRVGLMRSLPKDSKLLERLIDSTNEADLARLAIVGLRRAAKGVEASVGEERAVALFRGVKKDAAGKTVGGAFFYSPDRAVAEVYAGRDGVVTRANITFKNLLFAETWFDAKDALGLPRSASMADLVAEARAAGHDGVTFKTSNGPEYIHIPDASVRDGVMASKRTVDQTETPEFKAWFKGSKVVDENGKPLVVYHGTAADFSEFKKSRKRRGNAYDRDSNVGFFFSRDARQADYFSFLKGKEKTKAFAEPYGSNIIPVFLGMINPKIVDFEGRFKGPDHIILWANEAKKDGNDGLIIHNVMDAPIGGDPTSIYIAFRPEQIKSAIGNAGTFDPTNPDIRYSKRKAATDGDITDDVSDDGKKKLRKSYKEYTGKLIDAIDHWTSPISSLPEALKFENFRNLTQGETAKWDESAAQVHKLFNSAPEQDQKAIYNYLTTKGAHIDVISPKYRQETVRVKGLITQIGKTLVEQGVIPEESRLKYEDAYLPQVYFAYLLGDDAVRQTGGGKKIGEQGYAKARKYIDKSTDREIRDVFLGEIKDPGYLAARAIAIPMRDLAMIRWMEQIASNPEWALPDQLVDWKIAEDKPARKVTPFYLKSQAESLRKRAAGYQEEAHKDAAYKLANRMDEEANKVLDAIGADKDAVPAGYKRMPDTPRYGALRGLVVRKAIYDDIAGIQDLVPQDAPWIQRFLGYGGTGTKITQFWKWAKVAANPPGQVRNFVSNMIMLNLSGIRPDRIVKYFAKAVRQIKSHGDYYKMYRKHGLQSSTFAASEFLNIEKRLVELERQTKKGFGMHTLKYMGAMLMDKTGKMYQWSESVAKLMKMMHEMEVNKLGEAEAVHEANKWTFDYTEVNPTIRYLRNAPIGVPFATYAVKVLPRLLEVAAQHPLRLLPYAAVLMGLPMMIAAQYGVDDDDVDKLRKALPEWMEKRGNALPLPYKDAQGRWQFVDVGYFLPWSQYWDLAKSVKDADAGEFFSRSGALAGPFPSVIAAVTTGKDPFTDKPILNEYDPAEKQFVSVMQYVYGLMAPPWLVGVPVAGVQPTFKGFAGHAYDALTGHVDKYGDPTSTGGQAALRLFGVNTYAVEPQRTRAERLRRMKFEISETKRRMMEVLRKEARNLTEAERKKIVDQYREEIEDRRNQMIEYMRDSEINPALFQ